MEEADYKSTTELFKKKGDEKTLDNFIPKSESDFLEYAELISHKLRPYEVYTIHLHRRFWPSMYEHSSFSWAFLYNFLLQKSFHYINLLKDAIRLSMVSLKAADAKDVASSVTALANEKLKAEKEANAGKKKTGKYLRLYPSVVFQIIRMFEWTKWFWCLCMFMGRTAAAVKKKQLHVEKADDDLIVNTYDDVDDYDFM